ncbi:hypothetical protein PAPYR_12033 [Paratrimastix pyriformis]|uniref:Uncharacterized protein n=1 Tax=Paratrimastix pyriformis TaxID=342808 RepID=A0ABQ8U082_9EUKA|nr:hypothetical protein PAPYR_13447 [Paratrimastix pyriformis]KAJ4453479.1 hypothetical protein PAPYR_12033 [Paratrimastix pyriformis]
MSTRTCRGSLSSASVVFVLHIKQSWRAAVALEFLPAIQSSKAPTKQAELASVISALKRSAFQFGEALGQLECPIIHIKGHSHIFSCYDLGATHILAFYTQLDPASVEMFDTVAADTQMGPILREMALSLRKMNE